MIIVFILTTLGLGLTLFYIMYKQVFGKIVQNITQLIVHLGVLALLYSIMLILGYLLSSSLVPIMRISSHWVSMGVFFFLGMKMYRSIIRSKAQNWTFDTSKPKILFLFGLSNGFDAFFAGIGLGFWTEYAAYYSLIFAAAMIVFLLLAWIMARRSTATLSVWLFATLGSSLLGMNTFVILILWLFF